MDNKLGIRSELAKYKSALFDNISGLPTFFIEIDKIRKLLETNSKIGLIYINIAEGTRIEEMLGWQVYDSVIREVTENLIKLRETILAEKNLITLTGIRGDEFLIFVSHGENMSELDDEGIKRIMDLMEKNLTALLSSKRELSVINTMNLRIGFAYLHPKPNIRFERLLYRAIEEAKIESLRDIEQEKLSKEEKFLNIVKKRDIYTEFQPIVYLNTMDIYGYEALSRGKTKGVLSKPTELFDFACKLNKVLELEDICRATAISSAKGIKAPHKLFINSEVDAIVEMGKNLDQIVRYLKPAKIIPENIVIEMTERSMIKDMNELKTSLKKIRNSGFKFAIDDTGVGYTSLKTLTELKPDYLKFDISLIKDIHKDLIKMNLLKSFLNFSRIINANIIAEGIEGKEDYQTLKEIGVELGQGFFFAEPAYPFPKVKQAY